MTDPYTPTTEEVKSRYSREMMMGEWTGASDARFEEKFDRWFLQEIEKAEYSGYLRAVREGLHR